MSDEDVPGGRDSTVSPAGTPATQADPVFAEFEERYRRETSEVRTLSVQMQDIISLTSSVLDELADRPLWKRLWQWFIGHSYRLHLRNSQNQLRLQQANLLLTAAIARQNRLIVEGLRIAIEKLQRLEDDARCLRDTVARIEDRRLRRARRWQTIRSAFSGAWGWVRDLFGR